MSQEYIVRVLPNDMEVETVGELTRCRDCKYITSGRYGVRCEYIGAYTEEDNFCKWAEKVDGEA